jgi:hypothetical protein
LPQQAPDGHWSDRFVLVAEILSSSNDFERIDRKIDLYKSGSDNLHILTIAHDALRVVHRARSRGWLPDELEPEDRLVLPEFGFDVAVTDLYRGTQLAPWNDRWAPTSKPSLTLFERVLGYGRAMTGHDKRAP